MWRGTICTLLAILCASACTLYQPDDGTLTIVSLNAENLFDAELSGSEYAEFTPAAGWDERDVARRLQGIGGLIERISPTPHILVLTEIETEGVLNRLLDDFLVDVPLPYRVFARASGGATGIALASAFPIVNVRTLLARADSFPPLRPILEVHVRLPETDVVIFANHWKSKRGSAAATEPLRRATARLLSARITTLLAANPTLPVLVCGDLNEQPHEGVLIDHRYETALLTAEAISHWRLNPDRAPSWVDQPFSPEQFSTNIVTESEIDLVASRTDQLGRPVLFDPWESAAALGSFWYFDRWEQIDHIFASRGAVAGPLHFVEFRAVVDERASDRDGRPVSWTSESYGVTDHLPVMMKLSRSGPR